MIRGTRRSGPRRRAPGAAGALACAALLAACASAPGRPAGALPGGTGAAGAGHGASARAPGGATGPTGTTARQRRAGPAGRRATPAASARAPAVRQLITVTAPRYGDTYATLSAFQRSGGRWQRVLGPWPARIGQGGLAPPGAKREGDGRTPSGTFTLPFLFGTGPGPGFAVRYRQSHPWIAWDDDPASPRYNEWVDTRYASPGLSPEPMDVPAYVYGAVIGYNTSRAPGLGSAIFLHASIGTATAGCVTLPVPRLLRVLRWLDPQLAPRIRLALS